MFHVLLLVRLRFSGRFSRILLWNFVNLAAARAPLAPKLAKALGIENNRFAICVLCFIFDFSRVYGLV